MIKVIRRPNNTILVLILFFICSAFIVAGGFWWYGNQKKLAMENCKENLESVAKLKSDEIVRWRHERMGDAEIISRSPFFLEKVKNLLNNTNDVKAKEEAIISRLILLLQPFEYSNIYLIDNKGRVVVSVDENYRGTLTKTTLQVFHESLASGKVIFSDFYTCQAHKTVHIDLIAPLIIQRGQEQELLGALVFIIDPDKFLYPLIQSWSTPSPTAETLLVKKEGNRVLYLNTLRHRKDPPLTITLPLDSPQLPAAWAVKDHEGALEGRDYRGVPVFAVTKTIPGTSWRMVAKIDSQEVLAGLHREGRLIAAGMLTLILLVGTSMGWALTAQRKSHYKDLFRLENERQALRGHFEYLVKYANDIILLVDENLKISEVNDRACEIYGYSREEMLNMDAADLRDPATLAEIPGILRRLDQANGLIYETVQRRKDGTLIPVEVSNRIIAVSGRKYYQAIIRDISERKQAEAALHESEAQFRVLVENAPEAIFIQTQGRFAYINLSALKLFGATDANQLLGQEVVERFPPGFQAIVKERIRLLNEERKAVAMIEEKCLKLDGTNVEAEVSAVPFTFNKHNGALVFLRDITARKRAEENVLNEKALSDTIINSLPGVFYCFDDQGRFLRWNRNFEQVSGYSGQEFANRSPLELFEDEDRTRIDQAIREVFVKGQNTVEADLRSKDGGKAPYFFTGRRVDLGGIPCLIGMGIDFSDRKMAETKIKLNEARMASLAKIAQYESESLQDLLDFALDEAIAMTGSRIGYIYLYNDEKQQFILNTWSKEVMNQCAITEPQTIYQLEKTGIWGEAVRQARPIIVNDYQAPHPLKKGYPAGHAALDKYLTIPVFSGERIVAVVGVANKETDYSSDDVRQLTLMMDAVWKIVDRQRAEEELRRLNLELDQRVRDRTAQLEAANRELESFTYSVSHDLRSPLRGIDGWSQALLEDYYAPLGKEGRQLLDRVRWETQRMGQLIDDLLSLSRVGRGEVRREPVDLSALVQGIAGKLRETEPERQAEFTIQPGLLVAGDPRLLEIALFNLLDNAWKFTAKRSEAKVEFGVENRNGKSVFYVRDNGAGFDMAYAQKLFGAFQRLHKVSEFPGTGIGLATVQRIINRHGGRIWAEAALEQGATFFFSL